MLVELRSVFDLVSTLVLRSVCRRLVILYEDDFFQLEWGGKRLWFCRSVAYNILVFPVCLCLSWSHRNVYLFVGAVDCQRPVPCVLKSATVCVHSII